LNYIIKIKQQFKSKDSKVLLENFISLSALQLVGMLLPLITLPYVIRVLGFNKYGIIVLALSLINYFTSITDYSFRITATRDVSKFRNNRKKLSIIYSKVIIIKCLLFIFSLVSIGIIVFAYPEFYEERLVFFLTAPMLFGYVLFPEWFFQGIEQMKYITFLTIGIKLFFTLNVFIFIHKPEDYWIYPLLQSLGYIGSGLIGQYILIKKFKLDFYWISSHQIKQSIKENFPIFVNQFMPTLYNNTSTFLLGIMTSTALLGIYDAIKKIIDLCITLTGIVSRVFFPFLTRNKNAFKRYEKGMLYLGATLTILPIIFNQIIFYYLNIKYTQALEVLSILSVSIFLISLYDIYGLNYFIVNRHDKLVMKNTIFASVVGFILAFPLIHFWGIIGAAFNLTISRGIMGLGLLNNFKKHRHNEISNT